MYFPTQQRQSYFLLIPWIVLCFWMTFLEDVPRNKFQKTLSSVLVSTLLSPVCFSWCSRQVHYCSCCFLLPRRLFLHIFTQNFVQVCLPHGGSERTMTTLQCFPALNFFTASASNWIWSYINFFAYALFLCPVQGGTSFLWFTLCAWIWCVELSMCLLSTCWVSEWKNEGCIWNLLQNT